MQRLGESPCTLSPVSPALLHERKLWRGLVPCGKPAHRFQPTIGNVAKNWGFCCFADVVCAAKFERDNFSIRKILIETGTSVKIVVRRASELAT